AWDCGQMNPVKLFYSYLSVLGIAYNPWRYGFGNEIRIISIRLCCSLVVDMDDRKPAVIGFDIINSGGKNARVLCYGGNIARRVLFGKVAVHVNRCVRSW